VFAVAPQGGAFGQQQLGAERNQLGRVACEERGIAAAPAKFGPEIATFRPPQFRERTPEGREPRLRSPIALRIPHLHADQPRPVRLLRARGERPHHRTPNHFDEIASPHTTPSLGNLAIFGFQLRPSEHEIAAGEMGFRGQVAMRNP
jgi:hypothetical protein